MTAKAASETTVEKDSVADIAKISTKAQTTASLSGTTITGPSKTAVHSSAITSIRARTAARD